MKNRPPPMNCERVARPPSLARYLVAAAVSAFSATPRGWTQAPTVFAAPASESTHKAHPLVTEVISVGMTVSDLDRAVEFYSGVLEFQQISEHEIAGDQAERLHGVFGLRARTAWLRLGAEQIELTEYLAPEGRPIPEDWRSNDRSFQHIAIAVSDMDRAYARLRKHRVRHASSGPQRLPDWNPSAGGISAFYFKDPDGHVLEVIQFPPGKGDPRWHRASDVALFLGIDHTAIVVANTEKSLELYRDVLGLSVAGSSENHGTEQEHLNNIFGARLRITSLRAARGPGIEFLEYLAPSDGRSAPADTRASDVWHWQVRMASPDVEAASRAMRPAGATWVSPGAIRVPQNDRGFHVGVTARDADGHAFQLVQTASTSQSEGTPR